jgi:hypothetical protein
MRFEIHDLSNKKGPPPVRLALYHNTDGGVEVVTVDDDGDLVWSLLVFNSDGTITMCDSVEEDLGFQLDYAGRIQVSSR